MLKNSVSDSFNALIFLTVVMIGEATDAIVLKLRIPITIAVRTSGGIFSNTLARTSRTLARDSINETTTVSPIVAKILATFSATGLSAFPILSNELSIDFRGAESFPSCIALNVPAPRIAINA